jgi:hypothetical protein
MPTKEEITQIQSPLLRALFTECPNVNEDVHYFLSAIDENVLNVQSLNKTSEKTTLLLNPDFFPKIKEAKQVLHFSIFPSSLSLSLIFSVSLIDHSSLTICCYLLMCVSIENC